MRLQELEKKLRGLMKGKGGDVHPLEVARALADALGREARNGVAPNRFTVHVPAVLPGAPDDLFIQYLVAEAHARDLTWAGPIVIGYVVEPGEMRVEAQADRPAAPSWKDATITVPVLVVEDGFGMGKVFPVRIPTCIIGRGAHSDVRLGDRKVSHQHALIRWDGGHFVLEDLQSSNGTVVNGQAIGGVCPLQAGDRITLGYTTVRFQAGGGVAPRKSEA